MYEITDLCASKTFNKIIGLLYSNSLFVPQLLPCYMFRLRLLANIRQFSDVKSFKYEGLHGRKAYRLVC
jgi:hypothetical protein